MARPGLGVAACAFGVNGALYGTLLSRYAEIAGQAGAGGGAFGAALAAGAVGGLAGSVLAPPAVRRLGDAGAVTLTGTAYALLAVGVAAAGDVAGLAAALFVVGVVDGGHDVSANALAVRVGTRGAPVLGRMHAGWSLSLAGAAAVGAAAAGRGVPVELHVGTVAVAAVALQLVTAARARRRGPAPGRTGTAAASTPAGGATRPGRGGVRGVLLPLGLAAVAASYVEGPGQEWTALLLSRGLDAGPGTAAAAPLAFSAGLLAPRLVLDALVRRVRPAAVATVAAALVTAAVLAGLLVVAAGGPAGLALVALAVAGVGAGPVYPLLFSAADRLSTRHGVSPVATASVISTCSRIGAVSAPVVVGAVTGVFGLAAVLAVMAAGGALVLLSLPRAVR